MSTFLQLCQRVAQESGTISGVATPTTVVNQAGRLAKVVSWTASAWTQIQNLHSSWTFMRADLPATALTSVGTGRYTAASWNISDLGRWLTEDDLISIYATSIGVADEGQIRFMPWAEWRRFFVRGVQTNNRPTHYTISPQNEFCFGPAPNAIFRANGEYRKAAVLLTANGDTPAIAEALHEIIVWKAIILLDDHDEVAPGVRQTADIKHHEYLNSMRRAYLPVASAHPDPLA